MFQQLVNFDLKNNTEKNNLVCFLHNKSGNFVNFLFVHQLLKIKIIIESRN